MNEPGNRNRLQLCFCTGKRILFIEGTRLRNSRRIRNRIEGCKAVVAFKLFAASVESCKRQIMLFSQKQIAEPIHITIRYHHLTDEIPCFNFMENLKLG